MQRPHPAALLITALAVGLFAYFILLGFGVATASASGWCEVRGQAPWTAPSTVCTPGDSARLGRRAVCTPKERPDLRDDVRRRVLDSYGVPEWTGADGEIDHRIPLFLGGRSTVRNLWPQEGEIPNLKDRLETYIYIRVCRRGTMTPGQARAVFRGDWRAAYRRYLA